MLLRITNAARPYPWGSYDAIAAFRALPPSGGPEAEVWLGTHPGSPALLADEPGTTLAAWLAEHRPGVAVPFLVKILAAAAPLSLQAHPTPEQARAGFAREEAAGIPVDAPHRNYRDDNAKPEMIVALSDPFLALCGFRPVAEARAELAAVGDARLAPLVERLVDESALREVVPWLLRRGPEVDGVVDALREWSEGDRSLTASTVRRLAAAYPGDPGVAISTLMHTVSLAPGEALYLPAGNLHAYLEGLGIEVMATSDNVLRGGLTSKHVDVDELLRVVDFRPITEPRMRPAVEGARRVFRPDVPDFAVQVVTVAGAEETVPLSGPAIVISIGGDCRLDDGATLRRGEAAYVDERAALLVGGTGTLLVATANAV
ncbi:mannose-6-phosphate isomerase, class I [Microcella frigidaquae]|uniref:mannose-6-phosphate isomerase n=1 Tax=Microcella frigidaquae TaxID=424758 RepID=A0A840XJS8_9MICO|nr:mannose-6-phosphate isomerase [Microcella frigidaquae]